MNTRKKTLIFILVAAFLFVHFAMLISYMLRPNFISAQYAYPYFHQSWNLFVPAPECNYRLFAYLPGTNFRTDIMQELLIKHQSNRFKGYEGLLIALSNSIHYFEKMALAKNSVGGKVDNDTNFTIIEKFAENYLRYTGRTNVSDVKIILQVTCLQEKNSRIYYD